jgi:hypothetical protein
MVRSGAKLRVSNHGQNAREIDAMRVSGASLCMLMS